MSENEEDFYDKTLEKTNRSRAQAKDTKPVKSEVTKQKQTEIKEDYDDDYEDEFGRDDKEPKPSSPVFNANKSAAQKVDRRMVKDD